MTHRELRARDNSIGGLHTTCLEPHLFYNKKMPHNLLRHGRATGLLPCAGRLPMAEPTRSVFTRRTTYYNWPSRAGSSTSDARPAATRPSWPDRLPSRVCELVVSGSQLGVDAGGPVSCSRWTTRERAICFRCDSPVQW